MTTQLRLVDELPEPRRRPSTRRAPARSRAPRSARRAASWGDWHLDARTRRVGRAGVARARRALEAAVEQELRAS